MQDVKAKDQNSRTRNARIEIDRPETRALLQDTKLLTSSLNAKNRSRIVTETALVALPLNSFITYLITLARPPT